MARRHLQVMIPEDVLMGNIVDWMDQASWLRTFRPDDVQALDEVVVRSSTNKPELGCYVLLCEHPDYPEVPDYEEAPRVPYTDDRVLPASGS